MCHIRLCDSSWNHRGLTAFEVVGDLTGALDVCDICVFVAFFWSVAGKYGDRLSKVAHYVAQQQGTGSTLYSQQTEHLSLAIRSPRDIVDGVLIFPRKIRLFQFCIFNKVDKII